MSQSLRINDLAGSQYNPLEGLDPVDNDSRITTGAASFKLGEHWTTAGATGAGKTVFNIELMEHYRRKFPHARRFILNSTADPQFEDIIGAQEHTGTQGPPKLPPAYCSIWTPDEDILESYDRWLHSILYAREEAVVLLDDIASLVGYSSTVKILPGHMKLMKQGRKHGITIINGTQEMTRVPLTMFKQMTHFVQMRLGNDPTDLAYARRYLGITKEQQAAPQAEYGLFYKRVGIKFPHEEYDSYGQFFHSRARKR
jgi:hypothetical protein